MDKKILKKYNYMVSTIEDAKIYDGRGTYDLYQCEKCNNIEFTTYADKGVTPFSMVCKCGGTMHHTKSYPSVPNYIHVEKWIRPTVEELQFLSDEQIEHVLNGGLLMESDIQINKLKSKIMEIK